MASLTEELNAFKPTFRLKWYTEDDDTAPTHGWTAPDWTIVLGPHVYLVHSCELGKKSNFFSSLMNQAESQATGSHGEGTSQLLQSGAE